MARRIRVDNRKKAAPAKNKLLHEDKIRRLTNSIANAQEEAAALEAKIKNEKKELDRLMDIDRIDTYTTRIAVAEHVASAGKTVNVIDGPKFHERVGDKDFYESITVSVTKAKNLVPLKELETMTTSIPPKPGVPKLRVRKLTDAK